jgi:hypothetical protein
MHQLQKVQQLNDGRRTLNPAGDSAMNFGFTMDGRWLHDALHMLLRPRAADFPPEYGRLQQAEARGECYECPHAREVPGNAHIACAMPDASMTGNRHGIERGRFMYPLLFDPVWKTRLCQNRDNQAAVSPAISQATSDAENAQRGDHTGQSS